MASLRVAMVGCGGYARNHAVHFRSHPDAQVVALCDTNADQVAKFRHDNFADAKPQPELFADMAAMLKAVKPDTVSICTPHTLHYEHCCQALAAGCHVLVEKPMVTSLPHAVDLEARVQRAGKLLCIGYNTPCTAEINYVREAVRGGQFGKLKIISLYISQPWYHLCQGKWRMDPALSGGGMIYDSGAHVTNSLVWTVEADVAEVHAWVDNLDSRVDINGTINVKFVNGVLATIAVSGESPNGSFGAWMFEQGVIETNPWYSQFMKVYGPKGEIRYPKVEFAGSNPVHNFVDAILGRAQPRTSPRNGVIQSQLMDCIYASARLGKPVRPSEL
jgi:predicted dehydrogenase